MMLHSRRKKAISSIGMNAIAAAVMAFFCQWMSW